MVALALIGVDVVLRLLMIEPTTKPHVNRLEGETEPLLRNAPSTGYRGRSPDQQPGIDVEGSQRSNAPSRIPPIVRLAISGQLSVLLIASIVDAAIWTTFETVCSIDQSCWYDAHCFGRPFQYSWSKTSTGSLSRSACASWPWHYRVSFLPLSVGGWPSNFLSTNAK